MRGSVQGYVRKNRTFFGFNIWTWWLQPYSSCMRDCITLCRSGKRDVSIARKHNLPRGVALTRSQAEWLVKFFERWVHKSDEREMRRRQRIGDPEPVS